MKEILSNLFRSSIEYLKGLDYLAIKHGLEHTQEYLNWKDEMNAISVDEKRPDIN